MMWGPGSVPNESYSGAPTPTRGGLTLLRNVISGLCTLLSAVFCDLRLPIETMRVTLPRDRARSHAGTSTVILSVIASRGGEGGGSGICDYGVCTRGARVSMFRTHANQD